MHDPSAVTVVIPTWRRATLLRRCLDGVLSQEPQPGEVVVVGRAEDIDARNVVESGANAAQVPVRWVEVGESGHVPPVRRGLEVANGELIAFLDDDAVPQPGWLVELLNVLASPAVVCAGGRVHTPGIKAVIHRDAGRVRWYGKYVGNIGAVDAPHPIQVDAVLEGNWCWRTSTLRSLSFDPVLAQDDAAMYGLDLCLQAKANGGQVVYTSVARVLHTPGPRTSGSLDRGDHEAVRRSYSRNYTYIALSRFRGVRLWAFLAWWWLVGERASYGLATAAVDGLRGRMSTAMFGASLRGKSDGFRAWLHRLDG